MGIMMSLDVKFLQFITILFYNHDICGWMSVFQKHKIEVLIPSVYRFIYLEGN